MTSQTKLTKDLIFKMVQVTTKLNGRSKRALLPFVVVYLNLSLLQDPTIPYSKFN